MVHEDEPARCWEVEELWGRSIGAGGRRAGADVRVPVNNPGPPAPTPVEVTGDSGPAGSGAVPGGAELWGAESGGGERVEPGGAASGGAEPACAEPGGAESGGESHEGSETAFTRSPWSSRLRPRVPLTSQQLHDWYGRRQLLTSAPQGSTAGGSSTGVAGPGGDRTGGSGAAGAGGVAAGGIGAVGGIGAAGGAGGSGAAEGTGAAGGAGPAEGAGATGGAGAAEGTRAARGVGAAGGAGATGGTGAAGAGGTAQPRLFFTPPSPSSQPPPDSALRQVLSLPSSTGLPLQPGSPLPAPSPNTEKTGGLTERRKPASRPVSPVRSGRRVLRPSQPAVFGPHLVVRRPSSPPSRVPLLYPPTSSLPVSASASALVAKLVDFAAHCRLDYAASLVDESESVCPPSVEGECALGTDVLEDRQEDLECLAAAVPHLVSMLLAPEGDPDAPDIPTPRSYAEAIAGTYVDEVPPPGANIVSGMWIFRVKRPPGSPPVFKARYVARGFSQQEGVEFFHTFSHTPKMTTLRVLLHVAAQHDYELHSLDFSTAFLQGSLHEEIWLRRPPGFTGTTLAALGFAPSTADPSLFLRTDTSLLPFYILVYVDDLVFATTDTEALALITWDRAPCTITLTQSHMVQQVLQLFGFIWSSAQATPLATGHPLSAPPSDESVERSGPYPELVGCLMYLMTCTRPDLAYPLGLLAHYVAPGRHRKVHMDAAKRVLRYLCSTSGMGLMLGGRGDVVLTGHSDASWVDDQATQRSSQGYTFSLGSGSVSLRSTRSSSVLGSSYEAEIYATAMAAQELRWLTYLLTELGERPRSPPVLYVDNKAAIALWQEHRLEHRTKHIALCYFLARELQQRGQLRLTYMATRANTADIFTKALSPGDHQRFCTLLGLRSPFISFSSSTSELESRNLSIVRELYAALGSGDLLRARAHLAEDVDWWFHGPKSRQLRCMQFLSLIVGEVDSDGVKFMPVDVTAKNDKVISEGVSIVKTRRGALVDVAWVHVWTVSPVSGRVTGLQEFVNTAVSATVLGPASGALSSLPAASCREAMASSAKLGASSVASNRLQVWESRLWREQKSSLPGLILTL
ncbi:unnamed protein product [Closterium sp. NIES-53]